MFLVHFTLRDRLNNIIALQGNCV